MTREPSTGRSVVTNPSSSLSTEYWLASDVYKADVYDPSEHIGNVTDLVIDSNGNVTGAIIGVGGFLGISQKDVMIPFKELKVSTRDGKDWLVLNRTKDELKLAPAYNSPSEGGTPNENATSDGNQSLSEKLDKSGGVIKPAEEVDPQIVQPAPVPDPNSTPVIPPAGTAGGPPGPEPK